MTTYAAAFWSFTVGLLLGSLFLGNHISTLAQPSFAQESQGPPTMIGGGGIPIVPPLGPRNLHGVAVIGLPQQLDGINCNGCRIDGAPLMYSGGQYSCEDCVVSQHGILLKGAALNTFNFLTQVGVIARPKAPVEPANPNAPQLQITKLARPEKVTLVSLETK